MSRAGSVVCLGLVLAMAWSGASAAEDPTPWRKDPWKLYLFRVEIDNDGVFGSDDAFTAGFSLQMHSRLDDRWHPGNAKWIGALPGFSDGGRGGRIVRWAGGVGQMIITPARLSRETFQPDDAPYAGILGAAGAWYAYDNEHLAALQLYVGCMGPCSGGEAVQKFVHDDLGLGHSPKGWENQLADRWLANLNYEYRYKVLSEAPTEYAHGCFVQDFSVGAQVALGNFSTFAWGQVEYRFGWGMPMGFTKAPDPLGIGIMADPIYFDPLTPLPDLRRLRFYFTLVGRAAWITRLAPADGGETVNGFEHPGLDDYPGEVQALFGIHVAKVPFAFHLTAYKYFDIEDRAISASSDWVNLSFEWRF